MSKNATCSYVSTKDGVRATGWQCWYGDHVGYGKTRSAAIRALKKALRRTAKDLT